MNKFAIFSILVVALAAAVSANTVINMEAAEQFQEVSEFKIKPDDDGEVKFLSPEHGIFADFCRQSRDTVYAFIQDKNSEIVSNVFATFFGHISEVTTQLQEIQTAEAERVAKAIREGKLEEPEVNGEETTGDEQTGDEQTKKSAGLLKTVGGALSAYAKAIAEAATKELIARMRLLKETVKAENFKEFLTVTCTSIQLQLQQDLQKLFRQYKADLAKEQLTPEQKQALTDATFDKVGCLTTGRTRKVINVCGFMSTAGQMVFTMMGM